MKGNGFPALPPTREDLTFRIRFCFVYQLALLDSLVAKDCPCSRQKMLISLSSRSQKHLLGNQIPLWFQAMCVNIWRRWGKYIFLTGRFKAQSQPSLHYSTIAWKQSQWTTWGLLPSKHALLHTPERSLYMHDCIHLFVNVFDNETCLIHNTLFDFSL